MKPDGWLEMQFSVPYPPSGNVYWRHAKGRVYRSEEAREYVSRIGLYTVGMRPFKGPVKIHATVFRPILKGDLSNRWKILEDALQGIVYLDDEQIEEIHLTRRLDREAPRVEIHAWGTVWATNDEVKAVRLAKVSAQLKRRKTLRARQRLT